MRFEPSIQSGPPGHPGAARPGPTPAGENHPELRTEFRAGLLLDLRSSPPAPGRQLLPPAPDPESGRSDLCRTLAARLVVTRSIGCCWHPLAGIQEGLED